jgi:hypothetical protein
MRNAFRTIATLRSALSSRRDLLFEYFALRHQLGVLGRSDRHFRSADRLLWLCLRRWWPRWQDALVLVQPATVARWHREGFRGCWRRRSRRRPGRPRIDAEVRAPIRRIATRNRLWGASRIHGELVKLGITVSEWTVSRYLCDRLRVPSQTWRTFFANHFGALTVSSVVTSSDAPGDDDVINAGVFPLRSAPALGDGPSYRWTVVDWSQSLNRTPPGSRDAQADLHHRTRTGVGSGRGPPSRGPSRLAQELMSGGSFVGILHLAHQRTGRDGSLAPAGSPSAVLGPAVSDWVVNVVRPLRRLPFRRESARPRAPLPAV